jgi:hypothetical protein
VRFFTLVKPCLRRVSSAFLLRMPDLHCVTTSLFFQVRDLVEPARQLAERDVEVAVDLADAQLEGLAHVEQQVLLAVIAQLGVVGRCDLESSLGSLSPRFRPQNSW